MKDHLSFKTSVASSLAIAIAGLIVVLVPSWAPQKEVIIGIVTAVLVAVVPVANAAHALIAGKATPADLEETAHRLVTAELQNVDFGPIVRAALRLQDLGGLVQSELRSILLRSEPVTSQASTPTASPPPRPAPVTPTTSQPNQPGDAP